jgi:hypothetical protein
MVSFIVMHHRRRRPATQIAEIYSRPERPTDEIATEQGERNRFTTGAGDGESLAGAGAKRKPRRSGTSSI